MNFEKIAIGYPCSSYIVKKINTLDSLWYYCKIFVKTSHERGMDPEDILTHLVGTLNQLPLDSGISCPDFTTLGKTPSDICSYLIQNPTTPKAKQCNSYYRTYDSQTGACRICELSKLYRNEKEGQEYGLLKYMLSSEAHLNYVVDRISEESFTSCMDVSMSIPVPKAYVIPMTKILLQSIQKTNIRLLMFSSLKSDFMMDDDPFEVVWEDAYRTFPKNRKLPVSLSNNPMWQNALKMELRAKIADAIDYTEKEVEKILQAYGSIGNDKKEEEPSSPFHQMQLQDVVLDLHSGLAETISLPNSSTEILAFSPPHTDGKEADHTMEHKEIPSPEILPKDSPEETISITDTNSGKSTKEDPPSERETTSGSFEEPVFSTQDTAKIIDTDSDRENSEEEACLQNDPCSSVAPIPENSSFAAPDSYTEVSVETLTVDDAKEVEQKELEDQKVTPPASAVELKNPTTHAEAEAETDSADTGTASCEASSDQYHEPEELSEEYDSETKLSPEEKSSLGESFLSTLYEDEAEEETEEDTADGSDNDVFIFTDSGYDSDYDSMSSYDTEIMEPEPEEICYEDPDEVPIVWSCLAEDEDSANNMNTKENDLTFVTVTEEDSVSSDLLKVSEDEWSEDSMTSTDAADSSLPPEDTKVSEDAGKTQDNTNNTDEAEVLEETNGSQDPSIGNSEKTAPENSEETKNTLNVIPFSQTTTDNAVQSVRDTVLQNKTGDENKEKKKNENENTESAKEEKLSSCSLGEKSNEHETTKHQAGNPVQKENPESGILTSTILEKPSADNSRYEENGTNPKEESDDTKDAYDTSKREPALQNLILLPTLSDELRKDRIIHVKKKKPLPPAFYHGVLRDKMFFVEVVRSSKGLYMYLIWSKHMKKFITVHIEESPEELKKLFSQKKIRKVCHTPYALYGVSKLFKVPTRNVFSLQNTHGRLFPKEAPFTYQDLCLSYVATADCKDAFQEQLFRTCPFLSGMPFYEDIYSRLEKLIDVKGGFHIFLRDMFLDEALGCSYFYGLNFMEKEVLLILVGNNKIFFKKEFNPQKITEGRRVSYFVKEHVNALALFQYVLQRLAEKGIFRTCNIQVLGMDCQNMHLFMAKEQEEYLLSIIDLLLYEYGRTYLSRPFEVHCLKSEN